MAKKTKVRPWTKDHVRTLKTLAREKTKTTAIARKLNQSVGAMDAREEDTQPRDRTVIVKLSCWEEFVQKASEFDDPSRSLWDEVWFRGQSDASWKLCSTLERRSTKKPLVSAYLRLISEIKPAIETFTATVFQMPERKDIEERCRQYDLFHWFLLEAITYMAHLRHGGFPSPLLNWTSSPYVAAYFAFSRANPDGEVAIYAYRERPKNMKVEGSDMPSIFSFGPLIKTHKRHFRQQSRYTMCVRFKDDQWYFTPHETVRGN